MSLCGHPYEDGDDFDESPADVWREKMVTARKDHACSECGGKIGAGERYGYAVAIGGEWGLDTWRRCASCLMLAEAIAQKTGACPRWGDLDSSADHADMPSPRAWRRDLESKGRP